jgi:hypothetical protein
MNFEKKDLLTYDEMFLLLTSESPNERANIICKKLNKYCFYFNNVLYKFDSNLILYKKIDYMIDEELITIITGYISESKNKLSKENDKLLNQTFKSYSRISEEIFINKNLKQIKVGLKAEENKFKPDFYEIHYKNGFIDIKTKIFKKREIGKHYVCNYINRDYKPSNKEQKEKIYNQVLNKIYPDKNDLNAILFILGSAITGKATKLQKILFLLGLGSSGKSTILQLTEKAIPCYFETLSEDAFSENNKNKDKTFSTFKENNCVRVVWINEPKTDKMDDSAFKKFCEGIMKIKLLWKDGEHNIEHYALPIFTANIMPNINVDTGVKRRFRAYCHVSEFTEQREKVNESKNIYLCDRDLMEKIMDDNLLDAWVDILVAHANKWVKGEEIPIPDSFKTATNEVINANDHFQDFIDKKLIITNCGDTDRIGKEQMILIYKNMFPNRGINIQLLISKLKEKGINYKCDLRFEGVKGCFIGVKENENDEKSPLDYGVKSSNEIMKDKDEEIKELKNKLKEMEEKIKTLTENKKSNIEKSNIEETKINKKEEIKINKNEETKQNVNKKSNTKEPNKKVDNIDDDEKEFEKDIENFFKLLKPSADDIYNKELEKIESGYYEKEVLKEQKKKKNKSTKKHSDSESEI